MRKLFVFGLFSLGVASLAWAAQRGAMAPSAPAPAVHAMPAAPAGGVHGAPTHGLQAGHAAHAAPVRTGSHGTTSGVRSASPPLKTGGSNRNNNNSGINHPFFPYPTNLLPGVSDFFNNNYPVPGLGFDYAHFFAVHPNWGRFNQFGGVGGIVFPWGGGGGFYMPVPYSTESPEEGEEQASSQQPAPSQPVVVEEPPVSARSRGGSYMSHEPVPEFVFVKHDGSTFSAVAYSWAKDKLQYVTKDGLRRTTGIETLDIPATERMNEERGNTVTFPKSVVSSVALSLEPAPLR